MTYVPQRIITVTNRRLTESTDLTQPLTAYQSIESYLVVVKNLTNYVVSLPQIFLLAQGIDFTQPVATALTAVLTDQFVAQYGTTTIPVTNTQGSYSKRMKVYDGIAYKSDVVHFTSTDQTDIVDDMRLKGTLDDLMITSDQDLSQCLVAVNGVFHKTAWLNDKLYVLDGFRTMRLSDAKDVTVVDTSLIGGHTIIPITPSMVSLTAYNGTAYLTLPQSIAGKTAFLVVDGYFYHLDAKIFNIADATHIRIPMGRLPLISQFRHNPRTVYRQDRYGDSVSQQSTKYTDAYTSLFLNQSQLPTATFQTTAFQLSRLSAFHSFVVVVNNPALYVQSAELIPSGNPQYYSDYSNQTISGMMVYGCGLCPSYLIKEDPWKRKSIFIQKQDNDTDLWLQSYHPRFVPALDADPRAAAQISARLIDYISA